MINSEKLTNSYLTRMDAWNDLGGSNRLYAKGGLIATIVPSTFAALSHTFATLFHSFLMVPLKCAAKILSLGLLNVEMDSTVKSIKSNSSLSIRFAVAAVAIPIIAAFSNSSAVKVADKLRFTTVYSTKLAVAVEAANRAMSAHQKYLESWSKKEEFIHSMKMTPEACQSKVDQIAVLTNQIGQIKSDSQKQLVVISQEPLPTLFARCTDYLLGRNKNESRQQKIEKIHKEANEKIAILNNEVKELKKYKFQLKKLDKLIDRENGHNKDYQDARIKAYSAIAKIRRNDLYGVIASKFEYFSKKEEVNPITSMQGGRSDCNKEADPVVTKKHLKNQKVCAQRFS